MSCRLCDKDKRNAYTVSLKNVNPAQNHTFKGNRESAKYCERAPLQRCQEMPPESQLFPECAIIYTRQDQRKTHMEFLHYSAECALCWTNVKSVLTRKYFCRWSFSWNAEPNTAICPSYLVLFYEKEKRQIKCALMLFISVKWRACLIARESIF